MSDVISKLQELDRKHPYEIEEETMGIFRDVMLVATSELLDGGEQEFHCQALDIKEPWAARFIASNWCYSALRQAELLPVQPECVPTLRKVINIWALIISSTEARDDILEHEFFVSFIESIGKQKYVEEYPDANVLYYMGLTLLRIIAREIEQKGREEDGEIRNLINDLKL